VICVYRYRYARRRRIALRLLAIILIVVSAVLPDHVVGVLTVALSLLSQRVTKDLRL
jgi:hypothetical protein